MAEQLDPKSVLLAINYTSGAQAKIVAEQPDPKQLLFALSVNEPIAEQPDPEVFWVDQMVQFDILKRRVEELEKDRRELRGVLGLMIFFIVLVAIPSSLEFARTLFPMMLGLGLLLGLAVWGSSSHYRDHNRLRLLQIALLLCIFIGGVIIVWQGTIWLGIAMIITSLIAAFVERKRWSQPETLEITIDAATYQRRLKAFVQKSGQSNLG